MAEVLDRQVNALSLLCAEARGEHSKLEKRDPEVHRVPVDTCACWLGRAHEKLKELMIAAWEEGHRAKVAKLGMTRGEFDRGMTEVAAVRQKEGTEK